MVDLNELYSPSKWSTRLSADIIVNAHGKIMKESNSDDKSEYWNQNYQFYYFKESDLSRIHVPFKTMKYSEGEETFLQIFSRNEFLNNIVETSIDTLKFDGL